MKPAIQKSLTQLQISVQGTNRRYCLSQKDVSLQDGKLRTNTLLNQPIQGLAEGMKAAYLTRPELIEGMVYLNLGNFDDWEAFKPKVEIWTDYKSSWLGKFDCVAETFVDNGTLYRIQMFMENLDQRE